MSIWTTFLYQPLVNFLLFLYTALGGNLGLAIIGATASIRLALIPLTAPGLKSAQKMQELKPKLEKLKKKHKDDKQVLAQAQMDLYKQHGVNPFGSILPMILQIVLLIALFQAFNNVLQADASVAELNKLLYPPVQLAQDAQLDTTFFSLKLDEPDVYTLEQPLNLFGFEIGAVPGLFLLMTAGFQFLSSKLMMQNRTNGNGKDETKAKKKSKPAKQTKNDEPNQEDLMASMQSQMLYIMPIMTLVIGLRFPSGLVLYWVTFSIIMIIQQLWIKRQAKQEAK